ncbi:uncharacterized protein [Rutidosis leptorrhynchoides]|uniref:uncharacterized protein n=1 Tax=Rutidosis leptorrhynchoides TaxID=125765 RepID=UPI003A9A65F6
MSRCFPFPPPGYEKKFTTDEPDLLKKEKRKEKKHKKDKKDKEKKEGKEKREKDRSEGKHKDKKDKHRDKKKDKERSKTSTPDDKNINEQFGELNGNQLHDNNNNNAQKKESTSAMDVSKSFIRYPDQNGDLVRNRIKPGDAEKDKFFQEFDRRIRYEDKGMGSNQFVVDDRKNNVNRIDSEKTDVRQSVMGGHQFVVDGKKNSVNRIDSEKTDVRQSVMGGHQFVVDGKRNNINRIDSEKTDVQHSVMDGSGFGRSMVFPNRINGATPSPFDSTADRRVDPKEKMREKGIDDKQGDKRKNTDRDKPYGKEKDIEKEKKKNEKSEQKRAERDKNKQIKKTEFEAISNNLFESSLYGVGSEGNLKKRKDMETNGRSHENELRPNKMARPISNIPQENGRKLDFPQHPGLSLFDKQGASQRVPLNSSKAGVKGGQQVNDMIPSPPISVSAKKPPVSPYNHVLSKPSPIKSPPVITNHVAAQSPPPVPTTKTQHNQFAAQIPAPKLPPSIPNPVTVHPQLPPLLSPPQPTTTTKQPVIRPKPPPAVVNKVAAVPPPLPPIPKKKPPHPDTKYLNQILSVPKLDEWCGFDDQEWLLSNKTDRPVSKKPNMEELQVHQVWSEAKHIESVDVCALPYVIPY